MRFYGIHYVAMTFSFDSIILASLFMYLSCMWVVVSRVETYESPILGYFNSHPQA